MKSTCLRLAAFLAALVASGPAHAEPSSAQRAVAGQLFEDADKLMQAGNFVEACPKYAESQRLDPQLGTLLYLGECYDQLGKTASAWAVFRDAAEIAAQKKDTREAAAKAKVAELERKLPKIVIVAPTNAPQSLEVKQNGELIGRATWGYPVAVDPGKHTIVATAAGFKDWSASVEVPAGASTVRVTVPELEAGPAAASGSAMETTAAGAGPMPAAEGVSRGGFPQRTIGFAAGGVGLVGLGLGTLFLVQMNSKVSDRDAICPDRVGCQPSNQVRQNQLDEDAHGKARLAAVSFAVGGAAVVGGLVLVLTAPKTEAKSARAVEVTPLFGPSVAGAAIGGRW